MPPTAAAYQAKGAFPQDAASDAALDCDQLSKAFRSNGRVVQALDEVSFRVRHGTVTGLIGPDSAGKTTLMRLAAGLLAPDAGSVSVLGRNASAQSLQVQALIGYMPQRFGLYEDLTVQENLDLYADLQGVARSKRQERYRELLHMAGLAAFTRRLAGQLSGGMKQKLGLACALIHTPKILFLDEPTNGVDPVSRRDFWKILYELLKQKVTILFSTSYLDEAERCARIGLIHKGALLRCASPDAIKKERNADTLEKAFISIIKEQ